MGVLPAGPNPLGLPAASSTPPAPTVTLLAGFHETTGGWNLSFPLNFTVPTNGTSTVYAWAIGGNFTAYVPPELPAGMSVRASIGFEGMALGNLSAGSYSTDLAYAGWTNIVSLAVYSVSGGATFQFGSLDQINQHPLSDQQVALSLPAGGSGYLGIESTGGTWPVTNSSLTTVDEETGALQGGVTGVIGRQSTPIISFESVALGGGVVGVALDANVSAPSGPAIHVLNSFSETTGGWDLSFPLTFFVPVGVTQVIYAWALGGNFTPFAPPVLPSGMHVAASVGFEGLAVGNLTSGTYATNLTYAGWTNVASIAVYGISGASNVSYRFDELSQPNPNAPNSQSASLTLPAGATEYLGVESTGGTWPVQDTSFTTVDEFAYALREGHTGEIGRQGTDTLSCSSIAAGIGIVGVAVYANGSGAAQRVTFEETGLPSGASWTLALGSDATSASSRSLTLSSPAGVVPYLVAGPRGYRVSGMVPSGSLSVPHASLTETVSFVPERTVNFAFRESGLPQGGTWCVDLGGWQQCSSGRAVTFSGLTPGTYAYAVLPSPLYGVGAKVGGRTVASQGTVDLVRSEKVALRFTDPVPVTFTERGLAPGTPWSITVKGHEVSSTNASLVLDLTAGSYTYKVGVGPGYSAAKTSGRLRISSSPATVDVRFSS